MCKLFTSVLAEADNVHPNGIPLYTENVFDYKMYNIRPHGNIAVAWYLIH